MSTANNRIDAHGGWTIVNERAADDFGLFRTKKSLRKNPRTGAEYDFFLIDGLNWCNIIAITNDNEIVLVRQYRHGKEGFTLELPGGCVEEGEDPAKGVIRELSEETGYSVTDIRNLGSLDANPALMSIKCSFFFGQGAVRSEKVKQDAGEDIDLVVVPVGQIKSLIANGSFCHGLQVAAVGLAVMQGYLKV